MNATDILRYGHFTALGCLDGVPDDDVTQPGACGIWSIKDIVAHLASYELVLIDILASLTTGDSTPHLDRFLEIGPSFNDVEVDERRERTMDDVLTELNEAHARVLDLVAQIPAETLRQPGTLPWYGAEYALDDLIVYQYYGHKREHAAQVAAFRDRHRVPTAAASSEA